MPPIGTLLVEAGAITQKHLDEALQCQVLFGGSIGTNLLELGFVDEATLTQALGKQLGVPAATLEQLEHADDETVRLLPAPLASDLCAVPLRKEKGAVVTAMADPRDMQAIQELERALGNKISPVVVVEARLAYLLEKYYDVRREHRYTNLIRSLPQVQAPPPAKEIVSTPAGAPGATGRFDRMTSQEAPKPRSRHIAPRELDDLLETARTRDDVAQIVLAYAQNYVRRACLLVVKRDVAYGWAGYGERVESSAVRGTMVPLSQNSVFRTVYETHTPFIGPMAETPINKRFLSALGSIAPQTVVVIPIAYSGNLIALLYGDNGEAKGVPPKHIPELKLLSDKVARTFQRLIEELRGK